MWNSRGSALSSMSETRSLSFFVTLDPHEQLAFFPSPLLSFSSLLLLAFFLQNFLRLRGPSYAPCFYSRCSPGLRPYPSSRSLFLSFSLFRSHVQLAFTSVFPSHSRGSWRSDLSAVLTADRDRQACNYIVIYACYGAQPAWPVGLQRASAIPRAAAPASLPLALSRMWI